MAARHEERCCEKKCLFHVFCCLQKTFEHDDVGVARSTGNQEVNTAGSWFFPNRRFRQRKVWVGGLPQNDAGFLLFGGSFFSVLPTLSKKQNNQSGKTPVRLDKR